MRYTCIAVLALSAALVATCYITTGGPIHHLSPLRIRVLDAATDRPLPGAVVAAQWRSSELLCIHGDCYRSIIRTAEAVTDTSGLATIPAASRPRRGFELLHAEQPRVLVYKAGYVEIQPFRGNHLLRPAASPAEAASIAQAMVGALGSEPWQWPPTNFPRLATEIRTASVASSASVKE